MKGEKLSGVPRAESMALGEVDGREVKLARIECAYSLAIEQIKTYRSAKYFCQNEFDHVYCETTGKFIFASVI